MLKLAERGFKTILARVVSPGTAYEVYRVLSDRLRRSCNVGALHGRMPVWDRARVFRALEGDMRGGEPVVFVATTAIEAGVDLDFDAGVVELTPYRSLEQTLGRVNRHYKKPDAEVVVVGAEEPAWAVPAPKEYLDWVEQELHKAPKTTKWEQLAPVLREVDEEFTRELLSTPRLLDMYDSPYSRLLAVSFYSLFHLEGTMLEYLVSLSKDAYETGESLDIVVEVEGEPGNHLRVPAHIAGKLKNKGIIVEGRGIIPAKLLHPHNYVRRSGEAVKARGLVLEAIKKD